MLYYPLSDIMLLEGEDMGILEKGSDGLIGSRLRSWRKNVPLKSFQLAQKINITPSSLSDIELNKSLPSADTLAKLTKSTSLNIKWLLTGYGKMDLDISEEEEEGEFDFDEWGEMCKSMKRIVKHGDDKKVEMLKGFIIGADPGE